MGDRGIIIVEAVGNSKDVAPAAVYSHWNGSALLGYVGRAAARMKGREGDATYAIARLVGIMHEDIDGNTGLGLIELPEGYEAGGTIEREYSHGDAGVVVWNCTDNTIRAFSGYLAGKVRQGDDAEGEPVPIDQALERATVRA